MQREPIVGILLAAGSASRFGGDKLLAPLSDGMQVGVAALRNLAAAVDAVVAVVRPGDDALAAALAARGARVTACPRAGEGMGASLAWGVRAAPLAAGWVIALADMPWIQSATIARVADALRGHATIAAPSWRSSRGHPVGLASGFYAELSALTGDEGAKAILGRHRVALIATEDAGVLRDVDTLPDLEG
ncbi:MAG: nucleotidyltransferase family protein [Betaproteobacteria bacterium]|nr:MAG: nucleotidyltransferase family protein [Betaproteobacteria bacterium]